MRTVVLGALSPEIAEVIERRRATGADLYDEVWEGEYHMAPAPHPDHALLDDELSAILRPLGHRAGLRGSGPFSLGGPEDYRVPDRGLHRVRPRAVWVPTAALVVEIVSPDDETWAKLGFYAVHEVDEVLIVDSADRSVSWLARQGDTYEPVERSALLDVAVAEVAAQIDWS